MQKFQALVIYFNMKRFSDKIIMNVRKLKNLTSFHLNLIGDKASENDVFLNLRNKNNLNQGSFNQRFEMISRNKLQIPEKSTIFFIMLFYKKVVENISKFFCWILNAVPLIHPDNNWKIAWDIIALLLRLIISFMIPVEIAFKPYYEDNYLTIFLFLCIIFDCALRYITVLYVQGAAMFNKIENFTEQFRNNFILDFLSLIPAIFLIFQSQNLNQITQFIALAFMIQLRHINKVVINWEDSLNVRKNYIAIFQLIKLIFILIFIIHLFSCFWFYISIQESNYETTWLIDLNLVHSRWSIQYLYAFYFSTVTMLTIGYGDITPTNPHEQIVAIFFMLMACIWMSYCINIVGTILTEISQSSDGLRKKMRIINRYLNSKKISHSIQFRIREYLAYQWQQETEYNFDEQTQIINSLSNELKQELQREAHSVFINECQFLNQNFSQAFKDQLLNIISSEIIQAGTVFTSRIHAEEDQYLIFIEEGYIEVANMQSLRISVKQVLGLQEFITEQNPSLIFRAAVSTRLLLISKKQFLQVIRDYQADKENFQNMREKFLFDNQKPRFYDSKCLSCCKKQHSFDECPLVKLTLDKELVIKRHLYQSDQIRNNKFQRNLRVRDDYHALANLDVYHMFHNLFTIERGQLIKEKLFQYLEYQDLQNEELLLTENNLSPKLQKVVFSSQMNSNIRKSQKKNTGQYLKRVELFQLNKGEIFEVKSQKSQSPAYYQKLQTQIPKSFKILSAPNTMDYNNLDSEHEYTDQTIEYKIKQFNANLKENVRILSQKLSLSENQDHKTINKQLEHILFKYDPDKKKDETILESIQQFKYYMPESNIKMVLKSFKNVSRKQSRVISKFVKYISFPAYYYYKYVQKKTLQKNQLSQDQQSCKTIIDPFVDKRVQDIRQKIIMTNTFIKGKKKNSICPEPIQIRNYVTLKSKQ